MQDINYEFTRSKYDCNRFVIDKSLLIAQTDISNVNSNDDHDRNFHFSLKNQLNRIYRFRSRTPK